MLIQYNIKGRKITTFDKEHPDYTKYNNQMKINARAMNDEYEKKIAKLDIDDVVCAYRPNKSVVDAVLKHVPNNCFIKVDITDFFNTTPIPPNISQVFYSYMIEELGLEYTYQGLAISPVLTNFAMIGTDRWLKSLEDIFSSYNVKVTRYSDDITISYDGSKALESTAETLIAAVTDTLEEKGYKINEKKTKVINFEKDNHCKLLGVNIIRGAEGNYIKERARRKASNSFTEYNHKRFEEHDGSN